MVAPDDFLMVFDILLRVFQSPSLRGSGRFKEEKNVPTASVVFQSPSLRGSGRFVNFTPFSRKALRLFQSPSLRGSGRFLRNLLVHVTR